MTSRNFSGKTLFANVRYLGKRTNPRRKDTRGHRSFEIVINDICAALGCRTPTDHPPLVFSARVYKSP